MRPGEDHEYYISLLFDKHGLVPIGPYIYYIVNADIPRLWKISTPFEKFLKYLFCQNKKQGYFTVDDANTLLETIEDYIDMFDKEKLNINLASNCRRNFVYSLINDYFMVMQSGYMPDAQFY